MLSPYFGLALCEQFIGLEFLSLGDDPHPEIRKETVLNLNKIARIVSKHFFQKKMLAFYTQMCSDPDWIVRKAAVEVLIDVVQLWYASFPDLFKATPSRKSAWCRSSTSSCSTTRTSGSSCRPTRTWAPSSTSSRRSSRSPSPSSRASSR